MDEIDALFGLDVSDEEKQRMLSDVLRERKRAADFFAISPTFQDQARIEQQNVLESAKQAGLLKKALEDRKSREKIAADRDQLYRDLAAAKGEDLDPTKPGVTKGVGYYWNPETREFYHVGFRYGVPVNMATQERVPPELMERLVERKPLTQSQEAKLFQSYTDKADPLIESAMAIKEIDRLLKPYAEAGTPVADIKGMGTLERLPILGKAVRLAGDIWATGDTKEEQAPYGTMWSAVQKLMNAIKKERIGSQQTKIEIENITDELGRGALDHPDVFIAAFDRIKDVLERDMQMQIAAIDPAIMQQMDMRYAEINAQNPLTDPELLKFERYEFPESKNILHKIWPDKTEAELQQEAMPDPWTYPPHWTEEDIRAYEDSRND